jgi:hypothetical protein
MQYLLVETPEGVRRVELARDQFTVGRLPESDVPLPYAQVSRRHAELRKFAGEWWIRDLGSTNGLHLGAHRVQQHRLASGERVLLAPDVALRFIDDEMQYSGRAGPGAAPSMPARTEPTRPPFSTGGGPLPPGPLVARGDAQDHYRRTMPAQRSPIAHLTLHVCQTCGQRTAPDVDLCYVCHQSIARPCDVCRTSLLPIHDRCPRCQTPNPAYVGRRSGNPSGA